jgi:REP element-mobilizing transposase RayT
MTILRQLLLPGISRPRLEYGGDKDRGKRKQARPFSSRRPLHVTLRSTRARGLWSLRRKANHAAVLEEFERAARRFGVKVYEMAVVGNHIHALVRARRREALANFLRWVAGRIAQRITGASKGKPCAGSFWDETAWSRVVTWGNEFRTVRGYIRQNILETMGLIAVRPRCREDPGLPSNDRPSAVCVQ